MGNHCAGFQFDSIPRGSGIEGKQKELFVNFSIVSSSHSIQSKGRWLNFPIISGSYAIQSEGRWLNLSAISGSHTIQSEGRWLNFSIISGSHTIQSQRRWQNCTIYQVWLICREFSWKKSDFAYWWYIVLEKRSLAIKQNVSILVLFRAVDMLFNIKMSGCGDVCCPKLKLFVI